MADPENLEGPVGIADSANATAGSARVFISYASQDKAKADAVCQAVERAGIACWIAPRDVVPGESYAGAIVHAIDSTKLTVLVLSESAAASPHVLREVERTSSRRHAVVAFRIDLAPLPADLEYFLNTSQWLDASTVGLERALPQLIAALQRILTPALGFSAPDVAASRHITTSAHTRTAQRPAVRGMRRAMLAVGAMSGLALGYLALDRLWLTKHDGAKKPATATATATVPSANDFNPPAHSIAVLPFVNISGDKDQEYFSDGLTEELLNSLARINELQVAARTSAFSFKGKDADIATIARALNVGAVLEGSVRRSAHTVRITAQLINAITGFHFWSQTYDRDLGDVLKLQTDIANSVASALKVTLLGDMAAKIELGGTRHPAAFDAYLRGRTAARAAFVPGSNGHQTAIAEYTEAIRLDPNYALAFAVRSLVVADAANFFEQDLPARNAGFDRAQADARHAIALAPGLAEGHVALAFILEIKMNYAQASEEYDRAIALGPGNVVALANFGGFAVFMGRTDVGIVAARRAVAADPLNWATYEKLGQALAHARRYEEALVAYQELMALNHEVTQAYSLPGLAHYLLGQFESARAACELKPDDWQSQMCLAVTYRKLGQRADAERLLSKMKASGGDSNAYQYAEIYAQWGNAAKALEWLDTALRLRDGGLEELKTDPLLDPLRQEPHFRSIERALKFPTVEAQ